MPEIGLSDSKAVKFHMYSELYRGLIRYDGEPKLVLSKADLRLVTSADGR